MTDDDRFAGRAWEGWTVPEIVDVAGVPTAYRRAGEGETLVYLHGGGGTRAWHPIHAQLAEHFDVIAPEHPGFGDTPRRPDQKTWEDYVLHYDAFFRALELDRIHLVGTSLGAWLAANLAVYYPDRFATLTLVTPMGVLVEDDPFVDLFRLSPEEDAELFFNGRQDRYDLGQAGAIEDAVLAYAEATSAARLIFTPRYERRFDVRLARATMPSLVLGAEDDRLVGTGQAPRFAELLPQSTLVLPPGPDGPSSHGLVFEQPEDVVRSILSHVESARQNVSVTP